MLVLCGIHVVAEFVGRRDVVVRDAFASEVHEAEFVLGKGISLLCRLTKPLRRLGAVLPHAFAFVVPADESFLASPDPM